MKENFSKLTKRASDANAQNENLVSTSPIKKIIIQVVELLLPCPIYRQQKSHRIAGGWTQNGQFCPYQPKRLNHRVPISKQVRF